MRRGRGGYPKIVGGTRSMWKPKEAAEQQQRSTEFHGRFLKGAAHVVSVCRRRTGYGVLGSLQSCTFCAGIGTRTWSACQNSHMLSACRLKRRIRTNSSPSGDLAEGIHALAMAWGRVFVFGLCLGRRCGGQLRRWICPRGR